jgi:DNA-binding transcriptional MocR family regulator
MDYKARMNLQTVQTYIPPGFIDLGAGNPQPELLPLDILRNAAQDRLNRGDNDFLQYGAEQGDGYFRDALAKFLAPRCGFTVSHDDLFVTAGNSSALDLLCSLFTKPGDTVFVEEPTYFLALRIFADHDLNVVSIRTDETGPVMDDLIHALKEHHPKFLYIIPAFHNPGGHTIPAEQRKELLSLAERHGFLILADEVYQFLAYTQVVPQPFGTYIHSDRVVAMNSFSKILAPGLRLGWLQAHPSIMQRLNTCGLMDSGGGMNPFTSAIVQRLIENGDLDENISHLVDVLGKRVQIMDAALREHLPQARFNTPHGGYFFWIQVPGVDAEILQKKAQAYNVGLRPGIRFSSRNSLTDYFRLSVSFYNEDEIQKGILRLRDCLQTQ